MELDDAQAAIEEAASFRRAAALSESARRSAEAARARSAADAQAAERRADAAEVRRLIPHPAAYRQTVWCTCCSEAAGFSA